MRATGTLANGLTVAVKRLSLCYKHEKEFQREVECLLKVKHANIVRFLGYCADTQGTMDSFNGKVVMADIQERLLCFEYLPKGSLDKYITDASSGLEWSKRYKIIKGVCKGLSYLHQKNIIHLDLKPANILLDANLAPKISDFGLSRIFEEDKSRFDATKVGGTIGYLAPEFTSNVITHKFDLYSLGVMLIEILTGKKGYEAVETVLESWSNRLDKSQVDTSFEQIRVCAEIGIECIDPNPEKRPVSIHHIVARLNETGSSQVNAGFCELLDVQPLVLRFPFETNKFIRRSLQLTNNTDEHIIFRLMNKNENQQCFVRLPLFGIVPPRCAYTLFPTTDKQEKLPEHRYFDLILESIILGDELIWSSKTYGHDEIFEKAKNIGSVVREVTLKAVCTPQQGIKTSEVLDLKIPYNVCLSDTHPTKPWFITGYGGRIRIWSYETQKLVGSFKVSGIVCSIKFVERKKWFVAGTKGGFIHVYSYDKMKKITSFRDNNTEKNVISLDIHPTQSYMLSVSQEYSLYQIKLWDWNRGWECTQTFMTDSSTVVFNPMDIAIASSSRAIVKIWAPDSAKPKYTLFGHKGYVTCLQFFTRDDQQYLITGSEDCTAKIWDMQKRMCVHTMNDFMSKVISVFSFPNLPILIIELHDGTAHFWSSANLRVEEVIQIGVTGNIRYRRHLSCLMDPRRLVIQHEERISVMYIDNVGYEPGSMDSCKQPLNANSILGNTSSEVILGTSRLLDVHPMLGSLELINNTDEGVAFRVMKNGGIVPARSTYTLIVEHAKGAILESSIMRDAYMPFEKQYECDEFFEEAKEMGNVVHELALEANFAAQGAPALLPIAKITLNVKTDDSRCFLSLDAHPTDLLVLTSHATGMYGCQISLWNYDTPAKGMMYTEIDKSRACPVKFVAQKQRFVALSSYGYISVYKYKYGTGIQIITYLNSDNLDGRRLAVPSIVSYVSSLSEALIKLWDWNKGSTDLIHEITDWKSTQTFEAVQSCLNSSLVFNRNGINCSAFALHDYTIKVSKLDSPRSEYTLSGHSDTVNCLEFFKRDDQHYLITGSDDCTAKIWDLQRKTCVHTLRSFMSPVISVISFQDLPYVILSSHDGIIHIWNSRNSRLERMISLGWSPKVPHLYLMGTKRVVIERDGVISFMDIDNKEGSGVTSIDFE